MSKSLFFLLNPRDFCHLLGASSWPAVPIFATSSATWPKARANNLLPSTVNALFPPPPRECIMQVGANSVCPICRDGSSLVVGSAGGGHSASASSSPLCVSFLCAYYPGAKS